MQTLMKLVSLGMVVSKTRGIRHKYANIPKCVRVHVWLTRPDERDTQHFELYVIIK